jgi:hypothetical protein
MIKNSYYNEDNGIQKGMVGSALYLKIPLYLTNNV